MELSTKPNITLNSVVLGFFYVAFRFFFEDKTSCVPFAFLCIGRKPERKKRVSAGCGNGVCSVSSDSAEKCLVGFPTRHQTVDKVPAKAGLFYIYNRFSGIMELSERRCFL